MVEREENVPIPVNVDPGPRWPAQDLVIVDYDPRWPAMFEEERARILEAIGPHVSGVHHYGSTSIPGMAAKPIIDILVTVPRMPLPAEAVTALERIGYVYKRETGDPQELFIGRGEPVRTHHAHFAVEGGRHHLGVLLLRDYFRARPAEAKRYEQIKRDIHGEVGSNLGLYFRKKFEFLVQFNKAARAWHESGRPAAR